MSISFAFSPNGPTPTLTYTQTAADGEVTYEETYKFKYMYGSVEGQEIGGQILVPLEKNFQPPEEVMAYLHEQEELYDFRIAPESRVDGHDVEYSSQNN